MRRRHFNKEFKLQVLQELDSGRELVEVCREHEINSTLVSRWRQEYEANPQQAFAGNGNPSTEQTTIAKLERKVGQLYLQNEFVKGVNEKLRQVIAETKKNEK